MINLTCNLINYGPGVGIKVHGTGKQLELEYLAAINAAIFEYGKIKGLDYDAAKIDVMVNILKIEKNMQHSEIITARGGKPVEREKSEHDK